MNELTLKDAIQELEELSTGNWVPYEYSPEEAKLILNHINNLQSKIDKINEFIDGRIQILTVSVDNKAKDEYFNNKCIGGIQELKNVKEFLKEDK